MNESLKRFFTLVFKNNDLILPAYFQTTEHSCHFWVKFHTMPTDKDMSNQNSHHNWKCIYPEQSVENDTSIENKIDISAVLSKIQTFPITLKDDKRSLVKQGALFGKTVIAKNPRDKNRRTWMRLLSVFRSSEALSSQETLSRFAQQNIESVKPLCVFEQRKYGCLVDSWLIYEFREGHASNLEQLPDILEILKKLHQHGYRHDDPNFGNFLIDPNHELFLIDCKGKKRLGYFSDYYDFMLLSQRNEGVDMNTLIKTVHINTNLWGYKLAEWYSAYKRKRTELKAKRRNKS